MSGVAMTTNFMIIGGRMGHGFASMMRVVLSPSKTGTCFERHSRLQVIQSVILQVCSQKPRR